MVDSADGCGVRLFFSYGSAPSPSPFPLFHMLFSERFAVLCRHVSSRTRTCARRCQDVVRWKDRYSGFIIIVTAEPDLWGGEMCIVFDMRGYRAGGSIGISPSACHGRVQRFQCHLLRPRRVVSASASVYNNNFSSYWHGDVIR
jgi:hypothetical protein